MVNIKNKHDKNPKITQSKIQKIKETLEINKKKQTLINDWIKVMAHTKMYNRNMDTFEIVDEEITTYGWQFKLLCPWGLSFEQLESVKCTIEDNLECMMLLKKNKTDKLAYVKLITNGFITKDFAIVKTKNPFEIYIGNVVDGEPAVVDMKKYPHCMLSGSNGSGKSRLLDCILTNLICNNSYEDLTLYLVQLAKNDLIIYEDVKHCYAFCNTLEKTDIMLNHIIMQMDYISQLIAPLRKCGKGSDIHDYNKLHKNNKIPVRYVVVDEYASLTDSTNDNKENKDLKSKIVSKIERIAQYGRALGVFLIVCLQRPTANMLSPFVKSQSNLRISGKQNNSKSSEVAMDDSNIALNLEERIFVYKTYDYDYIKTPTIDDKMIINHIKPYLQPNKRTLFDDAVKLNKVNNQDKVKNKDRVNTTDLEKGKENIAKENQLKNKEEELKMKEEYIKQQELAIKKQMDSLKKDNESNKKQIEHYNYDKVDPNKHKELINNIKKIPNFVPYNPNAQINNSKEKIK